MADVDGDCLSGGFREYAGFGRFNRVRGTIARRCGFREYAGFGRLGFVNIQ
jgi:hypothetical protein